MKTSTHIAVIALTAVMLASIGCREQRVTTPDGAPSLVAGQGSTMHGKNTLIHCVRRDAVTGSGRFGPPGGSLRVGTSELIIPPGALTDWVEIRGEAAADTVASIRFWPEGLRFRKPAGLVLDAAGCDMPETEPRILYLDESDTVLEVLEARFDRSWQRVAAPISHFSRYALGV